MYQNKTISEISSEQTYRQTETDRQAYRQTDKGGKQRRQTTIKQLVF